MEVSEKKGFKGVYALAIGYVISIYLSPIIYYLLAEYGEDDSALALCAIALPFIYGIVNYIYVFKNKPKIDRMVLLNCAIIIKYTMIPIYILGGFLIAICLLLMFSPIVIMIFAGPMVAIILSVIGWIYMIGGAAYSFSYISESKKQGAQYAKILSILGFIAQFFFTFDVISIMFFSLKEKRCVKLTIGTLAILILGFISIIGWIIVKIIT